MKILSFITFSLYFGLCSYTYAAKPFIDLGGYYTHEDNIGRAENKVNILSDNILNYSATASLPFNFENNSSITIKGGLQYFDYRKHSGFDHLQYQLGATLRFKPDLHFTSPWYSFEFKLSQDDYDSSELRNNVSFHINTMMGARLTDRILIKAGLGHKQQNARTDNKGNFGTRLFDTETTQLFIGSDYFYQRFVFYGQYTYQMGEVISSGGIIPIPTKILLATQEMQQDDAIDAKYGQDPSYGMFAYRIDANTHLFDFGINYALNRASALDLSIQLINVQGDMNNDYDNYLINLGYLYRFK